MSYERMNPAAKVVARIGGVRKTARIVGLDPSAVSRWMQPKSKKGTGGIIPIKHWRSIMVHSLETGDFITVHDFLDV